LKGIDHVFQEVYVQRSMHAFMIWTYINKRPLTNVCQQEFAYIQSIPDFYLVDSSSPS
jgi:hypothetical protein